jgi:hypothetical protein
LKPGLKWGSMVGLALVSTLVLLAAAALAAEETVSLGKYEVSFDLGNYTGYELEFEEMPFATVDGIDYNTEICWIRGDDGLMMIAINDYVVSIEATRSRTRSEVLNFLNNLKCTNVNTDTVHIDGKPVILGICLQPSGDILVCAMFWPDIHEVNGTLYAQVDCTIYSEASVELTEMLLNSITVKLPGEEEVVMQVRSESDRIEL